MRWHAEDTLPVPGTTPTLAPTATATSAAAAATSTIYCDKTTYYFASSRCCCYYNYIELLKLVAHLRLLELLEIR